MRTRSIPGLIEGAPPRPVRTVGIVLIAVVLVAVSGGGVLAQPPGNDDRADARIVQSVPYLDTVDTTEATPQANDPCTGEGEEFRTVWYSFTPVLDGRVAARASSSSDDEYPTIIVLAAPTAGGGLDVLDCNWGGPIIWQAEAGQEYLLMAGPWIDAPGGTLRFEIIRPPKDPYVRISVADRGRVSRLGAAVISGRVRCPARVGRAEVWVRVRQDFWRFIAIGSGGRHVTCGDEWTVRARSSVFRFAPGEATVRAVATACNEYGCARKGTARTVLLR